MSETEKIIGVFLVGLLLIGLLCKIIADGMKGGLK